MDWGSVFRTGSTAATVVAGVQVLLLVLALVIVPRNRRPSSALAGSC